MATAQRARTSAARPAADRAARPVPGSAAGPANCRTRLRRALAADLRFRGAPPRPGRHAWHPFPAKFPPQLPRFFIEELSSPGDTVLDPMCGSGTTLVEALHLGRRAIGCDIDPLARLIAAAKLTPMDASEAIRRGLEVLTGARRRFRDDRRGLERALRARFDAKTREFVDYWFLPAQQLELLALVEEIENLSDAASRRFFQVVLSSTVIAKSGGVSRARDLAHTRPHRVESKTPKSAFSAFQQRFDRMTRDLETAEPLSPAPPASRPGDSPRSEVRAARAEATGLEEGSVDLVVTSPPYANGAIDYMRAHKFSLVWLGMEIAALTDLRRQYIGHDAQASPRQAADLPERCEAILERLCALDGRKARVLRRYFDEMEEVFRETHRVVRKDGAVIVVVGSSVLRGMDVETPFCLATLAQRVDFELVGIAVRRLDRDRRMMPARWGSLSGSGIERRMHEEHVIGLIRA